MNRSHRPPNKRTSNKHSHPIRNIPSQKPTKVTSFSKRLCCFIHLEVENRRQKNKTQQNNQQPFLSTPRKINGWNLRIPGPPGNPENQLPTKPSWLQVPAHIIFGVVHNPMTTCPKHNNLTWKEVIRLSLRTGLHDRTSCKSSRVTGISQICRFYMIL